MYVYERRWGSSAGHAGNNGRGKEKETGHRRLWRANLRCLFPFLRRTRASPRPCRPPFPAAGTRPPPVAADRSASPAGEVGGPSGRRSSGAAGFRCGRCRVGRPCCGEEPRRLHLQFEAPRLVPQAARCPFQRRLHALHFGGVEDLILGTVRRRHEDGRVELDLGLVAARLHHPADAVGAVQGARAADEGRLRRRTPVRLAVYLESASPCSPSPDRSSSLAKREDWQANLQARRHLLFRQ